MKPPIRMVAMEWEILEVIFNYGSFNDPTGAMRAAIDSVEAPIEFPAPESLWMDEPLLGGVRNTVSFGFLFDDFYPFVYHFTTDEWIWIVPDGATKESFFAFVFGGEDGLGGWIWISPELDGLYYSFSQSRLLHLGRELSPPPQTKKPLNP